MTNSPRASAGPSALRALQLLLRAAPLPTAALAGVQVAEGVAPAIVALASGRLVGSASALAEGVDVARASVTTAIAMIAIALVMAKGLSAAVMMLHSLVGHRFAAILEAARMRSVCRLPGLAHFDDPKLADLLTASRWADSPMRLINVAGYLLRWGSMALGGALVAASVVWWGPILVVCASIPTAINNWRHVGAQTKIELANVGGRRHAIYHEELGVGLQPAREVRLFGLESWILRRQQRFWTESMAAVFEDMLRKVKQNLAAATFQTVVSGIPFVFALAQLREGALGPGSFSSGILGLATMTWAMRIVESFVGDLRRSVRFLPELFSVIDLPVSDPALDVRDRLKPPPSPASGIRFESVRFAYPGAEEPILDDFDLSIPAGQSIALVGENGAGKSTLVKLLCRFYDPDEGRITIDGLDIREFALSELRRRYAVVFQDFARFPLSARENIAIGCVERIEDVALVNESARRTGADEVIERLPRKGDTPLAKEFGGVDLSGGEWQRVALARAMASRYGRDSSILILDEPTAMLDVHLEHDLYERFSGLTKGLTTLLISHRFSTVRMADRVAVLEDRRIVESGSHDELMSHRGRYAELFELQARRFREKGTL